MLLNRATSYYEAQISWLHEFPMSDMRHRL